MRVSTVLLAAALAAAPAAADEGRFILGSTNLLTVSRMDPIINPGGLGAHVHRVYGGSAFRSESRQTGRQARPLQAGRHGTPTPTLMLTPQTS